MHKPKSIDATGEFSLDDLAGFKRFKKENGRYPVLSYMKSGVKTDYRITKIKGENIWLREMKLIDPEHLQIVDVDSRSIDNADTKG